MFGEKTVDYFWVTIHECVYNQFDYCAKSIYRIKYSLKI